MSVALRPFLAQQCTRRGRCLSLSPRRPGRGPERRDDEFGSSRIDVFSSVLARGNAETARNFS